MADMKIYALEVGMIRTNCYLILNEESREMIVVDPGDDADHICNKIRDLDGRPAAIFLTHGHFDHILAVNGLRDAYPEIRVYIGAKDAANIKNSCLVLKGSQGACNGCKWYPNNQFLICVEADDKEEIVPVPSYSRLSTRRIIGYFF